MVFDLHHHPPTGNQLYSWCVKYTLQGVSNLPPESPIRDTTSASMADYCGAINLYYFYKFYIRYCDFEQTDHFIVTFATLLFLLCIHTYLHDKVTLNKHINS